MLQLDNINIGMTVLDQDLGAQCIIGKTNFELAILFRNASMGK
jgi:hypothetical protein